MPALVRAAMFCAVILLGLMGAPIGFLAGFIGGLPNQFTTSFMEQWLLLNILWTSNPGAALEVFIQQPLIAMAYNEPAGRLPVWKLFIYPVPLAVHAAVAIFAAVILHSCARDARLQRLVSLLPGMAVLVFVTTYVQLASCCTGGPRWALDIWLFALAYDPLSTLINWQRFYLRVAGALPIVQAALALLGVALLTRGLGRNS